MTTQPTISVADAREVCAEPWLTEAAAHEQALWLQRDGYRVEWLRRPVPFGQYAKVAAHVYHPDGGLIGDITFRLETEP